METLLKVIAWPAAALVFGIASIAVFRRPLGALLDRTKKLSKAGIEAYDLQQLPAPAPREDALAQFMGTFDNPLVKEVEASIRADLKARKLEAPSDAQAALIRALAGTRIQLHFEQVYLGIWLSQVGVLRYLNARGAWVPAEEVGPMYAAAAQQYPAMFQHYSLDGYLGFLQSHLLIERNGAEIQITVTGREFLKWLIDAKKPGPFQG